MAERAAAARSRRLFEVRPEGVGPATSGEDRPRRRRGGGHRLDPSPRLEAIAVGYSLRFPDDLENLSHQFEVYDALYAWLLNGLISYFLARMKPITRNLSFSKSTWLKRALSSSSRRSSIPSVIPLCMVK